MHNTNRGQGTGQGTRHRQGREGQGRAQEGRTQESRAKEGRAKEAGYRGRSRGQGATAPQHFRILTLRL